MATASETQIDDEAGDSDWDRTGNKDVDQLRLYLSSLHYDCSFSVSNEGAAAQVFKCHRLVLATASKVFEKMLLGPFKESTQGGEDEIKLDDVSPTVFDSAMRFIYGNQNDFRSCELAVEIYRFAHKWMIECLAQAAEKFLIEHLGPHDVLLVFQMCIDLDIQQLLWKNCIMIIAQQTLRVLGSDRWLGASLEVVFNIYQLKCLSASESSLFEMLTLWGTAKCSTDESKNMRALIDPMLQKIRFRSMSCREFSAINKKCDVLTIEEQLKIMESICLSEKELMPPEFALESYPRSEALSTSKMFDWLALRPLYEPLPPGKKVANCFSFNVDKSHIFLRGIYLFSVDCDNQGIDVAFTCTIKNSNTDKELSMINFSGICDATSGGQCMYFDQPVELAKGVLYTVRIVYNCKHVRNSVSFLNENKRYTCGDFCTIFIHSSSKLKDVYGFRLSKN